MRSAVIIFGSFGIAVLAAMACGGVLASEEPETVTDAGVANDAPLAEDGSSNVDAPPSCNDTQSDSKNCGACGHDCLGGACSNGQCQATVFATTTDPQVPWLALDATRVLWLTSIPFLGGFGSLYACPKSGCSGAPNILKANFKGGALGSDGTTAFFSDVQNATLGRVDPTGAVTLAGLTKDAILWVTPRDGGLLVNAYYEGDAGGFSRTIYRVDLAAPGFQLVAAFSSATANVDNTAYSKTHVYLGAHNDVRAIYAAPLAGGSFTEVLTTTEAYVASMTSDGDRVYFVGPGGGVFSCQGDGNACGVRNDLAPGGGKFAGEAKLVLAADGALFIETSGGDVLECAPNDCANTVKVLAHETELATDWHFSGHNIAVDAQAVYYVTRERADGGPTFSVKRVARRPK